MQHTIKKEYYIYVVYTNPNTTKRKTVIVKSNKTTTKYVVVYQLCVAVCVTQHTFVKVKCS